MARTPPVGSTGSGIGSDKDSDTTSSCACCASSPVCTFSTKLSPTCLSSSIDVVLFTPVVKYAMDYQLKGKSHGVFDLFC